jgi:O-acetyl-ADP-ribose deacetylase (regulator of RNase III)
MAIKHVIGDATNPIGGKGIKFITHCCNNVGAWGSGFVIALSKRWGMPELIYRKWGNGNEYELGAIQVIPVEKDIIVINLIGQEGIWTVDGVPPIRYEAIKKGLDNIQELMQTYEGKNPTLHMPRMGAGLAGGSWDKIEEIIKESISADTTIYTLPFEAEKYGMKEIYENSSS